MKNQILLLVGDVKLRTLSGLTGILMFINVHFCKWRKSHPFRLFWKARRWRFWNFPPRLRCVAIFRMHIAYFQNNSRTNNVVLITDVIFNWTIEIFSWLPFSWETFAYCMRVVVENFCTTAKTILSYERNCNSSDCLLLNHYQNENVATRWLKLDLSIETSLVVTVSTLSSLFIYRRPLVQYPVFFCTMIIPVSENIDQTF